MEKRERSRESRRMKEERWWKGMGKKRPSPKGVVPEGGGGGEQSSLSRTEAV
jgi:hypothetical protein